jgi:hypothetical protein
VTSTTGALRLFLPPEVFLTVSGDFLEQYRDSILPRADSREPTSGI